jgi:pimeloyl-ACP methyl ester carboxylesterase
MRASPTKGDRVADYELAARELLSVRVAPGMDVGYAEYGDPLGVPVIFCHGFPGTRLEARHLDLPAMARGVRLIAPDRPGIGRSTQREYSSVVDWVGDGLAFAEAAGLDRFGVLGVSGGGPYALALAWAAPNRVSRVATVCSPSPIDAEVMRSLRPLDRAAVRLGRRSPRALRLVVRRLMNAQQAQSGKSRAWAERGLAGVDVACIATDKVTASLGANQAEATLQGSAGLEREGVLYTRAWGFPLAAVEVHVDVWHGAQDMLTPVVMAHHLAAHLPDVTERVLDTEGHFSLLHAASDQILSHVSATGD